MGTGLDEESREAAPGTWTRAASQKPWLWWTQEAPRAGEAWGLSSLHFPRRGTEPQDRPCAPARVREPGRCRHFRPIVSRSRPREFVQARDSLSPPPLPSLPSPAAPPLRKYSAGVPRAAQEVLCTGQLSRLLFLSQN